MAKPKSPAAIHPVSASIALNGAGPGRESMPGLYARSSWRCSIGTWAGPGFR
jgi:hypothetical protein